MIVKTSVLASLLKVMPQLRQQVYFKSSLTALSHAMEDQVLAGSEQPLIIACFQRERFYRQEAHRYRRIAQRTHQLYVLAAPETEFKNSSDSHESIAFDPADALSKEWHLVVIGQQYANCLLCREKATPISNRLNSEMDTSRRFEGIWTFDRNVSIKAAELLLNRIEVYRPELADKLQQAKTDYLGELATEGSGFPADSPNPDPFVQRLVTYLQAGQYKLLKAYRSISLQEHRERLVNSITTTIRRSLDPHEVMEIAVQELGRAMGSCRCLIYRCNATDSAAIITHEYLETRDRDGINLCSTVGQQWPLQDNFLFQSIVEHQESLLVEDTQQDPRINHTRAKSANSPSSTLKNLVQTFSMRSWLMVPVLYQGQLLGMVELHHCGEIPYRWKDEELALVEAIATQVGVALIQAQAYANLQDLNQQLEALDRTRSNLVAITGHELRTPLSTVQVCLESLATEPDMSPELRQVMLNTALSDTERMRKLVQDFLTLSRLESGRVEWNLEALSLQECIDLSLSQIRSRWSEGERPQIITQVPDNLPLVRADGEWLVETLAKLLDNACKFTSPQGKVTIDIQYSGNSMLKITVADTGRGIEPNRLEDVFDRFYQEEGALRRTTGGTGLGLAICRQIVKGWGGRIWADSAGKDQGSQFHFTVPIIAPTSESKPSKGKGKRGNKRSEVRG
ncbi:MULTISPECIES: DICT sensory domain-containing protein [unclassified Coleofasciculus]|uniref:DICT sensory domain-containing protein n=1 Tax=unclassified Coleofasciculus TaxID=2692782 RepID=UPI00187F45F3|nr:MULTISPECIES: DICT sensory domain-containing protein [unclassified Coleofasciculus]MBE9129217.1 GAF domain-containing protein [Coleofasciculus sp. LEGE 07081]MBE9151891.1 GAF domain-containing protein [Coleofasciculus sp. LEGE 07092]